MKQQIQENQILNEALGIILEGTIRDRAVTQYDKNSGYYIDALGRVMQAVPGGQIPGQIVQAAPGYTLAQHSLPDSNSAKVGGVLAGRPGAMGALSTQDPDITLKDVYTKKNTLYNTGLGAVGGGIIGGALGGTEGAMIGTGLGAAFGAVNPALQYGFGKASGKIGNYVSPNRPTLQPQ